MKRHELLFMLLPCLFLAGVALMFYSRENTKPAAIQTVAPLSPLQLSIKSIRKVPPSADNLAAGYDLKVLVLLGHTGKAPPGWGRNWFGEFYSDTRLLIQRKGKWVRLTDNNEKDFKGHGIPIEINGFQKKHNAYQFAFILRLREVPNSYGAVTLKSDWFHQAGKSHYSAVGQPSFAFLRRARAPHAKASISLRLSPAS